MNRFWKRQKNSKIDELNSAYSEICEIMTKSLKKWCCRKLPKKPTTIIHNLINYDMKM